MGTDFEKLNAQMGNKVIACDDLKEGRSSGMRQLVFANISHYFGVSRVQVGWVEDAPGRVGNCAKDIEALCVSVRTGHRDGPEPWFLDK